MEDRLALYLKSCFGFLAVTLFLCVNSFAKESAYALWFYPSDVSQIYGIEFTLLPKELTSLKTVPDVYGLRLDVSPTGPLMGAFILPYIFSSELHQSLGEDISALDFNEVKKIYGLSAGFVTIDPYVIDGFNINIAANFATVTNGISLSSLINKHYIINGVTLAVFGNHDQVCRGLQLALVNSCEEHYGVQIGLWNKNQKRSLPFINWNFGR